MPLSGSKSNSAPSKLAFCAYSLYFFRLAASTDGSVAPGTRPSGVCIVVATRYASGRVGAGGQQQNDNNGNVQPKGLRFNYQSKRFRGLTGTTEGVAPCEGASTRSVDTPRHGPAWHWAASDDSHASVARHAASATSSSSSSPSSQLPAVSAAVLRPAASSVSDGISGGTS